MKKSIEIISHLKNRSFHSRLNQIECFNKLTSLLPTRLSQAISFMYIKNKTLFFVLNHPGYKMEFNYNVNLIKELLKKLKKLDLKCKDIEVEQIKVFNSNKTKFKRKNMKQNESKIEYLEKSTGNFDIKTQNETYIDLFKKIQKSIKKNLEDN